MNRSTLIRYFTNAMTDAKYIWFIPVLLMIFMLSGCASVMTAVEGDDLAGRGSWDEAALKYRDAYQGDPGNVEYRMKYLNARHEAANIHYGRGMEALESNGHDLAILEFQAALMLDPSLERARSALNNARKLKDSVYYYAKGIESVKRGDEKEARAAFKRSLTLDPSNALAKVELVRLKKQQKVVMDGYELDIRSYAPIRLEFKDAGVKKVFEVLSKLSGINFIFDSDMRDEKTTIFIKDATFQQALELIMVTGKLSRKVVGDNTIIVYPSTPQKIVQYEDMMIKVFYLSNSDAKKAVNLLKTMLRANDVSVIENLNAIVVRSRPDTLELARKILDATDLAEAEVMLDVNVMEIDRNKAQKLGLDLSPDSVSASVPMTGGTISLRDLGNFVSGNLLISLPSATLNLSKEDLNANILANPKIRVKNNEKAKIHVGERVPIITTTVNQGVTTENVQYQDVGLKLSVEPVIRLSDEVDIKIGLEVSSLGTKTTTSSGSVVYQIGTRNTETVLRLMDGETQIIGGLINDEERTTKASVPFLGDIPVLGRLFASVDSSKVKTEVLLSITPRIVRRLEVPDEAASGFLSGREDRPSAKPMLEGFESDVAGPQSSSGEHVPVYEPSGGEMPSAAPFISPPAPAIPEPPVMIEPPTMQPRVN